MKSDAFYGPVAMVALLARLVLAAPTNTTSEDFKNITNIVHPTNGNSSLTHDLELSFDENAVIFTNALHEYEFSQHSNNQPRADRLISETSPISNPSVIPENDAPQTNPDDSILKISLLSPPEKKSRIKKLETSINTFEARLNKTNTEVSSENDSEYDERLQFLEELYHEIKKDVDCLKNEAVKVEKLVLSLTIIYNIESDEFALAAENLKNGTNGDYIYAVRKVYKGQARNFELVLRFGEAVQDSWQKLKIFNALFYEMRTSGHTNSQMLSELTDRIKKGILDRATNSTNMEAQSLLDSICTLGILTNLQFNKPLVQERLEMGNERTIEYAVGKVYHHNGDNFESIIHFAMIVRKPELKLKVYESLYNEMSSKDRNSTEKLLELTQSIKTEVLGQVTNATAIAAQALLNVVCTDATKQHFQSGDFGSAAQMLNILGNNETYKYAVNILYGSQVANFDLVLRLGNSAQNVSEKFLIYEALYIEIRASGHNDSQKLSQLKQNIQKATPDQATDGSGFKTGQTLLDRINHDEIIGYLQSHQFASAELILDTCKDNIYESVVMEMYPQRAENFDLLRSFGDSMLNQTNRVRFFQVLYEAMSINGHHNTEQASKLSQSIQIGILDKALATHPLLSNNTKEEVNSSQSNQTEILSILSILNRPPSPHIAAALSLLNQIHYDNMVENIKSRYFTLAEQKLINGSNDAYTFVVKEIYDQKPDFDLLLNFANSTQDVAAKFKLYDNLYNTENSPSQDRFKILLRLYLSVNESSVHLKNYDPSKFLLDALKKAIIEQVVEPISSGFIKNATSLKAQQLSYEISKADIDLLYRVYDAVIKNVSGNLTKREILNRESSYLNQLIERMAVHEAMANRLKQIRQLQVVTEDVIFLVQLMNQVLHNSAYKDVPTVWRSRYEDSRYKLIIFCCAMDPVLLKKVVPELEDG